MHVPSEDAARTRGDCPECGAAGALVEFFCEVCYAELDEAGVALSR